MFILNLNLFAPIIRLEFVDDNMTTQVSTELMHDCNRELQ